MCLLFLFDVCDQLTYVGQCKRQRWTTYIGLQVLYFSVEWICKVPGGHDGDVNGEEDPNHQEQLGIFHNLQEDVSNKPICHSKFISRYRNRRIFNFLSLLRFRKRKSISSLQPYNSTCFFLKLTNLFVKLDICKD